MVKHLYAISPTGHIAHRNNSYLPHDCPLCSTPQETNSHLFVCPHPRRALWRYQTIQKINDYAQGTIDPHLADILRDGVSHFHRQLGPLSPSKYPERYTGLIINQNAIGWEHLYRGKWCEDWRLLQDDYCSGPHSKESALPGTTWTLGIGRLLIDQWLQLWKLRNEDRHGVDTLRNSLVREQMLHAELHDLYNQRTLVCPADRSLFYATSAEHIQKHPSLDAIEDWILTYRPAIMASTEQAQRLGITRNNTLHDYLTFSPIPRDSKQASLPAGLPAD